jgi:23S rRNA pseudouridine955/2504/2580 synthase
MRLTAALDDNGRRLDRILRKALPDMPLSALHRLLRKGKITVDGLPAPPSTRIKTGQTIEISSLPPSSLLTPNSSLLTPNSSLLTILHEDSNLLVLNKPAGIAVHGPESLEELVRADLLPTLPASLSFRPGPLHRLDKPTSGVIVFSACLEGARLFSALLREGKIRKEYLAVLDGVIKKEEVWEDNLVRDKEMRKSFPAEGPDGGGKAKTALTEIRPLASAGGRTLAAVKISTGRTHQIRAQAAARGHPLSGDRNYGGKPFPESGKTGPGAFFLHARTLEFPEMPPAMELPRRIEAPLPKDFALVVKNIFSYTDL